MPPTPPSSENRILHFKISLSLTSNPPSSDVEAVDFELEDDDLMDEDAAGDASPQAPLPKLMSTITSPASTSLSTHKKTKGRGFCQGDADRHSRLASRNFESLGIDGGPGPQRSKGSLNKTDSETENQNNSVEEVTSVGQGLIGENESSGVVQERVRRVTFEPEGTDIRRRRLWEFLAENDPEDGLDLSESDRFAFSVDDAITVSKEGSPVSRRWLFLSKLSLLFPSRFRLEEKEKVEKVDNRVEERVQKTGRRRKEGPETELPYLDMTDKVLDTNPELALMGSCLLVVLMRDEDVYVMNVGDSRAIVAQYEPEDVASSMEGRKHEENGSNMEGIVEETLAPGEKAIKPVIGAPTESMRLTALQLSTDHSTSIKEELREASANIEPKHQNDVADLINSYKSLYPKWVFDLRCGFGLLMYGFGSKKSLIEDFASTALAEHSVVVINGCLQSINIKQDCLYSICTPSLESFSS